MKTLPPFLVLLLASAAALPAAPDVPGLTNHPKIDPVLAGNVLLGELNCTACHSPADTHRIAPKAAPDLTDVASRLRPDFLQKWIADPLGTKPGTTMPDVLGHLPEAEKKSVATAISHFLTSRSKAPADPTPAEEGAADRGNSLYHQVGCAACHARDLDLAGQFHLSGLTAFLEDPLASRPGGRMPSLNLTHWQANDIAHYLLRNQKDPSPALTPDPDLARQGASFFQSYGCASCHGPDPAKSPASPPLANLDLATPCPTAHYDLSPAQQKSLASANLSPDPKSDIELSLTRLNCIACHSRDSYGGPTDENLDIFTTTNQNLGPQASIPPTLTGVGAKLNPVWLRKVLVTGASSRPYMNTRMPVFGAANTAHLPDLFQKSDSLPAAEFTRVKDEKTAREAGFQLAGDKGLGCITCHTFKGESASTLAGLDLTTMTERLQENWFHLYLRDPQKFHPQTIMPSYWPGGKAVREDVLGGDSGNQIDALWQFLSHGRDARTPSGIRREPLPLLSTNGEAVMLRRAYQGIGKRGIGVGYPSGINLSFDAGQLRLGSIWTGDFAETSAVWRSQGSGTVNEAGKIALRFPEGPALAILPNPDAPWPTNAEKQLPGFHFKGYTLDKSQRPTFRYLFGDITVTDRFEDFPDPARLVRTLTFTESPAGSYLRLAAHENITADGPAFRIADSITISAKGALLRSPAAGTKELLVPLAESLEVTYTPLEKK